MRTSLLIRATLASALGRSVVAGLSRVAPVAQSRPKFYADDPIAREPDTQDASKVQEWEIGLIADLTLNLFTQARRSDAGCSRAERQHD